MRAQQDPAFSTRFETAPIRQILRGGSTACSRHALDEMANDGLREVDVVNALRGGHVEFEEQIHGKWRYRVTTQRITVVVAFRSEASLVVVTAWRLK
jgi:hypothetical protein